MQFFGALHGLLHPTPAWAQLPVNVSDVVCLVSGPLCNLQCAGPECTTTLAVLIMQSLQPLIGIIATLVIVRSGFTLVYRGSDEELDRAKRSIVASLTAIALIFLAPAMVDMFYGGYRFNAPSSVLASPFSGAVVLSTEVFGFLRWITMLVAVGAVFVIVLSGVRAIASFGNEEGIAQLKRTVAGVLAGIVLLLFTQAIVLTFGLEGGAPTPIPIIGRTVEIINQLLLLAATIAVVMIIYAGITMIVFVGNEEKFTAAKSLILRVIIGIGIIFISWVLINFVMGVMGGTSVT